MKLAILISAKGSKVRYLIDKIKNKEIDFLEITHVIADRPAYGLGIAQKEGIFSSSIPPKEFSTHLHKLLIGKVDLILLAGFLSILDQGFCKLWNKKIINIHPSLLPKYGGRGMYGMHVHKCVIENKEKYSGATIHYVNKEIDGGDIIVQKSYLIKKEETPLSLSKEIEAIENTLLVDVLKKIHDNLLINKKLL